MKVNENDQVVLSPDEIVELWMRGSLDTNFLADANDEDVSRYNRLCVEYNREAAELDTSDGEPLNTDWFIGNELAEVDLREYFRSLVETDAARARVDEEMDLFEKYDLLPVLRAMIYLVDHFREKGVVWGVGRGSSVASYLLYLIGVHRIDPLRYDLPITDFIKP